MRIETLRPPRHRLAAVALDSALIGDQVEHISQGSFGVSGDPERVFSTILGSCVSTCLFDPALGVGGMNHLVLPATTQDLTQTASTVNDMEQLINGLLKLGAVRQGLQAKVFGGARMISGRAQIGARNADFVLNFLQSEGIVCLGQDLGGAMARRLRFWPTTGRVMMRYVPDTPPPAVVAPKPVLGEIDLF